MRPLRSPTARLLLVGAALLAAERWLSAHPAASTDARTPLHVTSSQLDDARRAFLASAGRAPDTAERSALIEAEIDDEILYREALARGLERDDPVVQRRLLTNMAFLADEASGGLDQGAASYGDALVLGMKRGDVVVRRRLIARMRAILEQDGRRREPSDADLEQALGRHPERFALPPRVRLSYVTVRADDRRGEPRARAQTLRAELRPPALETHPAAGSAARLDELPLQSERDLARLFGAAFAREVFALPTGRWSGPIASPLGQHLVWVHEREPARAPAPATVRNQVRALVLRERADQAVRQALGELRQRYQVTVDDAAPGNAS